MKKFALPVVFAALLGLALLAPVGGEAAGVLDKDVILVGTEATYPPFEYRNEKNEVVGYDIDVVEAIAKHLGKKVEIVDMTSTASSPRS